MYKNGNNNYKIYVIIKSKIVVPNKVSFGKKGFKYFFGYKDAKKVKPLCLFLSKNECIWKRF